MEKKPITKFLKVMSIITLIWSVLGVVINGFAICLIPTAEATAGVSLGPMAYISGGVCIVCLIINFSLAIMALQHKKLGLVYKIAAFTLVALAVFNATDASGIGDYIMVLISVVIPALFYYAAFKQNKLDQGQ